MRAWSRFAIAAAVLLTVPVAAAQDAILSSARQLREAGENAAAMTLLEQKLARDGESAALSAELGLTEARMERWTEAATHLREALAQSADAYVRTHRDELEQALARAEAETREAASPTPPVESDPFASDVDPDATALPMPAGGTGDGTTPALAPEASAAPGMAIPAELRSTLTAESDPAAPLERTDWLRPSAGLPLIGIFGDFSFDFWEHAGIVGVDDARSGEAVRMGGRIGAEVNLPLTTGLFATVRVFAGVTSRRPSSQHEESIEVVDFESIDDPNFFSVRTFGRMGYEEAMRMPIFGLEALARFDLGGWIVGLGGRFAAATYETRVSGAQTHGFPRGVGCDLNRADPNTERSRWNLGGAYGCGEDPAQWTGSLGEPFTRIRAWFLDVQALFDMTIPLTSDRSVALRVVVAAGKPYVSGNLGLVVQLGPTVGASQ